MKAIILAAGRGSRMKSLTDEQPKCLVEFRGKSLLDWQLEAIREAGIDDIAIVTGYRRELLTNRGLFEFNNPRWGKTQMVSSLACADAWLSHGPCIVSYSDIFYSSVAVNSLMKSRSSIAVTYDPKWLELWGQRFVNPLDDAETFRLRADGTLAEIGKRPEAVSQVQGQYMGLLKFQPEAWSEVTRIRAEMNETERDLIHMTGMLQLLIEAGKVPIDAIAYDGRWGEIDSAADLKVCEDRL